MTTKILPPTKAELKALDTQMKSMTSEEIMVAHDQLAMLNVLARLHCEFACVDPVEEVKFGLSDGKWDGEQGIIMVSFKIAARHSKKGLALLIGFCVGVMKFDQTHPGRVEIEKDSLLIAHFADRVSLDLTGLSVLDWLRGAIGALTIDGVDLLKNEAVGREILQRYEMLVSNARLNGHKLGKKKGLRRELDKIGYEGSV